MCPTAYADPAREPAMAIARRALGMVRPQTRRTCCRERNQGGRVQRLLRQLL